MKHRYSTINPCYAPSTVSANSVAGVNMCLFEARSTGTIWSTVWYCMPKVVVSEAYSDNYRNDGSVSTDIKASASESGLVPEVLHVADTVLGFPSLTA